MNVRMALLPRAMATVRVRRALLAALLSLLLGAALYEGLTAEHTSSVPPSSPTASTVGERLSSLPVAAQGPISQALGAADPRYRVGVSGGALQALNPGQRLRVRFEPVGVLLSTGAAHFALSVREVGYGRSLSPIGESQPRRLASNGVLYAHTDLREWYANGPLGLEQGFTVARAPAGAPSGPLTLSMALSGDVRAALGGDARSVVLSSHDGASLRYGPVAASDARGRSLHSWLEVHGGRILLRVDALGAAYPLRIDPLVQQARLSDGEEGGNGLFGYSVALSEDGSTALVGAPKFAGVGGAWIFTRSGATWSEQAELPGGEAASGGTAEKCGEEAQEEIEGCGFGRSVALSADGNTALVGSPRADDASGVARVYVREGSAWTSAATLTGGPNESTEGRFGKSVALSGDGTVALVGGPADTVGSGAAWIFTRRGADGSLWGNSANDEGEELTVTGEESGEAHFGVSVALSRDGSTALIGGPTDGPVGPSGQEGFGAAWIFARSGPETWTQQGFKLTGGKEERGEGHFGYSVSLSGEGSTALIGARSDNEGIGAAWVFTRSPSEEWLQQGSKLTAATSGKIGFGYSAALSQDGNTALIGSPKLGLGNGRAWVFTRAGTEWSETEGFTGSEVSGMSWSGASVALSGDGEHALVGAPTEGKGAGVVWAFGLGPGVSSLSPDEGEVTGGTPVTITGVDLAGVTEVDFGAAVATIESTSATSITVLSPPGKVGSVQVTVVAAAGRSTADESRDTFKYVASHKADATQPTVTGLSPDEGSTAGATTVTIKGNHLGAASNVQFGSTPAASVSVNTETEITAVSPAEVAGTVNVRVTTPAGTSAQGKNSEFTFTSAAGSGSSGGSGSSANSAAAGVLAFGSSVAPSCGVSLLSKSIAVKSPNRATFKLVSRGAAFAGICSGKLTLKARFRIRSKGAKTKLTTRTIGVGMFALVSGVGRSITVKLNAAGRALLRSGDGRLSAKAVILEILPGPASAHSAIVRLALAKSHKPKKS